MHIFDIIFCTAIFSWVYILMIFSIFRHGLGSRFHFVYLMILLLHVPELCIAAILSISLFSFSHWFHDILLCHAFIGWPIHSHAIIGQHCWSIICSTIRDFTSFAIRLFSFLIELLTASFQLHFFSLVRHAKFPASCFSARPLPGFVPIHIRVFIFIYYLLYIYFVFATRPLLRSITYII